jgi:4'-phosphopantetheinyl transferase
VLARRAGVPPEELRYTREPCPICGGPNGRPVLALPGRSIQFSISRSGGLTLVAVDDRPVGIDVEAVPDADTVAEVSTLMHAHEQRAIDGAGAQQRAEVFARLWTRKEAYLKGIGSGIAHGLDGEGPPDPAWSVSELPVGDGYVAAVAVRRER